MSIHELNNPIVVENIKKMLEEKNNLKVIEYIDGKIKYKNGGYKKKYVKLKCICSKEFIIRIGDYNDYKSCGCLRGNNLKVDNNRNLPKGEASFRSVYKTYKVNCNRKNRDFNLSIEEFKEIINKPCYYCGIERSNVSNSSTKNGSYFYNGIDRIDNKKGYYVDNVVPCCKNCNIAKASLTQEEFFNLIIKIYNKWEFMNLKTQF